MTDHAQSANSVMYVLSDFAARLHSHVDEIVGKI